MCYISRLLCQLAAKKLSWSLNSYSGLSRQIFQGWPTGLRKITICEWLYLVSWIFSTELQQTWILCFNFAIINGFFCVWWAVFVRKRPSVPMTLIWRRNFDYCTKLWISSWWTNINELLPPRGIRCRIDFTAKNQMKWHFTCHSLYVLHEVSTYAYFPIKLELVLKGIKINIVHT